MAIGLQLDAVRSIDVFPGQRTGVDYIQMFERQGIRIGSIVRDFLLEAVFSRVEKQKQVLFIPVSNFDLGCLKDCYSLEKTFTIGQNDACLEYCDVEEVLQFRTAYKDQPKGERLIVAMKPFEHATRVQLLSVEHDESGLWIYSYPHNLKDMRNRKNEFLWKLPSAG
ncbi:MAG TPA: hypothetical protein VLG69_03850 [Candidatus Andersenbacteria bacterium]|nr:hypothetical protein [Candidatus Andersenbacteria bacterium]